MNFFKQHIPAFVDVEHPADIPFATTAELLAIEVVQRYAERPDFSHFAMSDNMLMAISDGGYRWWVVGFIGHPELVDLSQWDGGRYRAELPSGEQVDLRGDEVAWSSGNTLALRNGTTARDLNR